MSLTKSRGSNRNRTGLGKESKGQGAAPPIHVHKTGRGEESTGQEAASPIHVHETNNNYRRRQGGKQNLVARVHS